jgi:hypothetical protein
MQARKKNKAKQIEQRIQLKAQWNARKDKNKASYPANNKRNKCKFQHKITLNAS